MYGVGRTMRCLSGASWGRRGGWGGGDLVTFVQGMSGGRTEFLGGLLFIVGCQVWGKTAHLTRNSHLALSLTLYVYLSTNMLDLLFKKL